MKKWLKGVAFWTEKGGVKSSDRQSESEAKPSFKKKESKRENGKRSNAGRPVRLDRKTHENLLRAYYTHPYSFRELADMFGVSRMTVWRAVQDASPAVVGM